MVDFVPEFFDGASVCGKTFGDLKFPDQLWDILSIGAKETEPRVHELEIEDHEERDEEQNQLPFKIEFFLGMKLTPAGVKTAMEKGLGYRLRFGEPNTLIMKVRFLQS